MPEWNEATRRADGAKVVISDVYKAIQSRLDGYRQGAGAIMIGVVAAVLAVDSSFIRALLDEKLLQNLDKRADHYFYFIIAGASALVIGVCIGGAYVIHIIGVYFAEMTSVIHKIDEANKMWVRDHWLQGDTFYPNMFNARRDPARSANVSRDTSIDPYLVGWHDPTINGYRTFIAVLVVLHMAFFSCLGLLGNS